MSALPLIELAGDRGPPRPRHLLRPAPQPFAAPPPEIDLDVQRVVLDVVNRKFRGLDTHIENSLTDGEIERTIEGASTLTLNVHDPKRALLRSGMFEYAIELALDKLKWRLVKVSKQDDDLTLTFEDRQVAYLRQHDKPRKATRGKLTRAEFALSLVREVKAGGGIKFVCPELHARQSTKKTPQKQTPTGPATVRKLTVKGAAASASQERIANRLLVVADSLNAPEKAALALVEAGIVESQLANLAGGDRDSRGVLQVRDSTARPMGINNRDVDECAKAFLARGFTGAGGAIDLARKHPSWSPGRIAQQVQGSAYGERYDKYESEAEKFVTAYGTTGGSTGFAETRYQFRRGEAGGKREDSWTCLQRLAEEVNWRCFMNEGTLWFISDDELMKAKPKLVISEGTPGVASVDFDIDNGKVRSDVTVTCRASRWIAAPGAVVLLKDLGPADGKWLVATLRRGVFDANAEITLKRATHKFAEPAADVPLGSSASRAGGSSVAASAAAAGAAGGAAGSKLARVYAAMQAIHSKHYPYVWGGGHSRAGVADRGTGRDPGIGFDCSGSTVAVLAAAGMGFSIGGGTADSKALMHWGAAGQGQHLTIWTNPDHVFMVVDGHHFGTGNFGKGWGGAGFNPSLHSTSGFVARHWPGT